MKKPTVEELEEILSSKEELVIYTLPNGEIRARVRKPGIELVAALCHSQWAGWMKYLFSKSKKLPSGEVVIPKELVDRWERQTEAEYKDLSGAEKESDRTEAHKFFSIFKNEK